MYFFSGVEMWTTVRPACLATSSKRALGATGAGIPARDAATIVKHRSFEGIRFKVRVAHSGWAAAVSVLQFLLHAVSSLADIFALRTLRLELEVGVEILDDGKIVMLEHVRIREQQIDLRIVGFQVP